jgi:hypothetical protein
VPVPLFFHKLSAKERPFAESERRHCGGRRRRNARQPAENQTSLISRGGTDRRTFAHEPSASHSAEGAGRRWILRYCQLALSVEMFQAQRNIKF